MDAFTRVAQCGVPHRLVDPAVKAELGIIYGLLCLSAGLRDAENVRDDLTRALAAARVCAAAWLHT